ncbi:MAG: hypothetical protein JSS95_17730 [Acidobacteria bacterium]|nr:hypothetical protein [Acidobacteriota bacterium]
MPLNRRATPVLLRTCNDTPFLDDDLAAIKGANLDLLLYLGHGVPGADLSGCVGLGAWSVQQDTFCEAGEVPGQFWDMYEGNRFTLHGLQIIERRHNSTRVVYCSYVTTNFLSLALNQNAAYWEITNVLIAQLSDTARVRMNAQICSGTNVSQHAKHRTLGNLHMARFLARWVMWALRNELTKLLLREQWSIVMQTKADVPKADHGVKVMRPPRDHFYADPFLFEKSGRSYLFFEDYWFSSRKGVISCCVVDSNGNYSEPQVVLERNYHLSYPFLFAWQGEIYMIPETRDNGTVEMYRASDFPYSWVHEAVLMSNVAATDSTLLHHNDKWWMFTAGVLDHASPDKALFLFFADSPLGPWTTHPKNPIVFDVCHARPAGCLYFDNGQLIRPGQDCSKGYGYAAQLHRVDVLSETDYQESLLTSITPDWVPGSRGIHTFNQSSEFRVIDCKFHISRFGFNLFSTFLKAKAEFGSSFDFESAKRSR